MTEARATNTIEPQHTAAKNLCKQRCEEIGISERTSRGNAVNLGFKGLHTKSSKESMLCLDQLLTLTSSLKLNLSFTKPVKQAVCVTVSTNGVRALSILMQMAISTMTNTVGSHMSVISTYKSYAIPLIGVAKLELPLNQTIPILPNFTWGISENSHKNTQEVESASQNSNEKHLETPLDSNYKYGENNPLQVLNMTATIPMQLPSVGLLINATLPIELPDIQESVDKTISIELPGIGGEIAKKLPFVSAEVNVGVDEKPLNNLMKILQTATRNPMKNRIVTSLDNYYEQGENNLSHFLNIELPNVEVSALSRTKTNSDKNSDKRNMKDAQVVAEQSEDNCLKIDYQHFDDHDCDCVHI
uniref:Uncharacterized protein n=1 Tax=Glossina pallidipes TaxID=7398 RepID=A0A1A9ZH77_GLOPL